ncbi:MAG TPA: hypothetical protein VMZ03_10700 [Chitinophagaceae bacterium]|nr:hypothetical protein [Chitinophagaceae bacterium]
MESNFNNRDFERFVKQNADQYRMFPSEKVWKNVHGALHTRRRWYGLALALLLITTTVVTWVMLVPDNRSEKLASISSIQIATAITPGTTDEIPAISVTGPVKIKGDKTSFIASAVTKEQDPFAVYADPADIAHLGERTEILDNETINVQSVPVAMIRPEVTPKAELPPTSSLRKESKPVTITASSPSLPFIEVNNIAAVTDKPAEELAADKKQDDAQDLKLPVIPERVAKQMNKSSKKKLSWQVYVTPTVSYRTLKENTEYIAAARYNNYVNGTSTSYSTDVNTMVNHRPDLGFQVGVRTAYPLSKWVSITGGFQLSVSKYDIKAYDHPAEVATIALSDRSVSTMSSLRNTNGYNENWLRNFYFTASIPVGLELKLSDGTKNYFGVAGTLQPTYVLDNRAYLISGDYKNYAEVPSLTRRWNMNTSFEVFSAFTTGKIKWRVGPQLRYQAMSSFVKNYPIKEHLFDFGLKLGIQLR